MKILVLGVGNVLYRDEAVGVKTVLKMQEEYSFPENVRLLDGGTLGMGLMDSLMDADLAVIIDAVKGGHEAGTLYRLVGDDLRKSMSFSDSLHQTDLVDTLIYCDLIGHRPDCVVIGVEPEDFTSLNLELSPKIQEAVPKLIHEVLKELEKHGVQYSKNRERSASSFFVGNTSPHRVKSGVCLGEIKASSHDIKNYRHRI